MNTDRFKFRIWHDTQGMIYPDGIYIRVSEDKVMKLDPSIEEPRYFIMPLQDYDIMQCTGLKDSEGKLIFEGDIVEVILNKNYPAPHVCTIVFQGMGFWFMDEDEELFVFHPETYHLTVIGNIYELQG